MDERIQEIFESNTDVIKYCIKKLDISPADIDDMFSVGRLGLLKAALTFDEIWGVKFASYAMRCITNEIFAELRRRKKYAEDISLNQYIFTDFDESHLYLEDILSNKSDEVEYQYEIVKNLERTLDFIINCLRRRERLTILLVTAGYKHDEVSKMIGVSQSYISKIVADAREEIREENHSRMNFRRYEVKVTPGKISVSFEGSMEVVERIIENENSFKEAPMYILKAEENGNVKLVVMTDPESMALLALVLDKLEKRWQSNFATDK